MWQRWDQTREPSHICKARVPSWYCWHSLNQKCWPTQGLAQLGIFCNYNRFTWNNQGSVNLTYSPGESTSSYTITNETQMLLLYSFKARRQSWWMRLPPLGTAWICEYSDLHLIRQLLCLIRQFLHLDIMMLTQREDTSSAFWEIFPWMSVNKTYEMQLWKLVKIKHIEPKLADREIVKKQDAVD